MPDNIGEKDIFLICKDLVNVGKMDYYMREKVKFNDMQ